MRRTTVLGLSVAGLILSIVMTGAVAGAFAGQTTRVSVNSDGVPANMTASSGVLSADGRYVVFWSSATNLIAGVFTSGTHVYRHDRATGATVMVSLNTGGSPANNVSRDPSVSADGRYVAFSSFATDIVAGGTNGVMQVFVRDMQAGATLLVSASATGVQGDLSSGLSGLGGAREVSNDGRYVAFTSFATNLVASSNNGVQQVYVKDMTTGAVVRASANDAGDAGDRSSQTPSLSGDGRFVAFRSESTNFSPLSTTGIIAQVFVRDLGAGVTTLESPGGASAMRPSTVPVLSFDGRYMAFVSEARLDSADLDNGTPDVYWRDRQTGTTALASLSPNTLSGAFSGGPSISGDGRWVAFNSIDERIVSGDTNGIIADVFVYDRDSQTVTIASRNDADQQANAAAFGASLSHDGGLVLFSSTATNLAPSVAVGAQLYVRILASNAAPVLDAGPDETVDEGQWLKRFGSFSDDGSTSWTGTYDYGAGAFPLGIDPVKKMWFFQHEPLVPGDYTVTLSITDDAGATGTDTFRHTVRNVAPGIVGLSGDETIYFGSTFRRNVYLADPGQSWPVPQPAETYSATVDYGDGTGTTALSGTYFTLEHTYANAGTYVVTMTASDSNGGTSTASLTLHVLSYQFDWLVDGFVVGRNQPAKFTVHAPDGTFVLDQSVRVDVVDAYGNVVLGPYVFGEQPSRAITTSGDAYHVNVDTRGFAPGSYRLRVRFASATLMGEFSLSSTNTSLTVRSRGLR